jgi:hypothetical protein
MRNGGQCLGVVSLALLFVSACDDEENSGQKPDRDRDEQPEQEPLSLEQLSEWTRHPGGPMFLGVVIAGDPHVWRDTDGVYRMVYTDGVGDHQAIAMATSTNLIDWTLDDDAELENGVVLQGAGPSGNDLYLETSHYRRADDGKHQIFYIGYPNEAEYHAAIYKAEADDVSGPYERESEPVINFTAGGADAQSMTSPTIVEHEGTLYMSYVGWATFPDGPIMLMGATSNDDGRTWQKQGVLSWDDIFGVEAHTEKGPDGLFYRVGVTGDDAGNDQLSIGQAEHPFGPYTVLEEPILTMGGPALGEGDSVMSPSLLFDSDSGVAFMHYASVDTGGWPWVVSLATCDFRP